MKAKEWIIELIKWQIIAVVISIIIHLNSGGKLRDILITSLTMTNSIALIITLIHIKTITWYKTFKTRGKKITYWTVLSLGATSLGTLIGMLPLSAISKLTFEEMVKGFYFRLVMFTFLICIIVVILEIAYSNLVEKIEHKVRENEKLKHLHVESQLRTLQAKVNPHFLFNTLNTILNLTDEDPKKVKQIVLNLSEIYRKVLYLPDNRHIQIHEEFSLIQKYLEIEKIRFGNRLEYEIDLPAECKEIKIPPLLIEPLVENAIIHGISTKKKGGKISLHTWLDSEFLKIRVKDNGPGLLDNRMKKESGFGLYSIRKRLKLIFHDQGRLIIRENPDGGVNVTLEIPNDY